MKRYSVIFWGAMGAIIGSIGDVLIFTAAKGSSYASLRLAIGTLLYASCGIAWYWIVKSGDGTYSSSAAMWSFIGALISMFIALVAQEKQTFLQWLGFSIIILGIIVRSIGGVKNLSNLFG